MATNRIRRYAPQSRIALTATSAAQKTQPASQPVAAVIPQGFALCPPQLATANSVQQEIYRLAYQRAQAAVQVPRHYRQLFSVWN